MQALNRKTQSEDIPQLGLWKILWLFTWPALWYTFLIYGLGPRLFPAGSTAPTWFFLLVFVLGSGAELAAGVVLLRREGYRFSAAALRGRLRLRWPRGWKSWGLAGFVLLLGLGLSMAMEPVSARLASTPGFAPPSWWPAINNPNIEIHSAADLFPEINLVGNVWFLLVYLFIGLFCNVLGEELYYRGFLLPRMRAVFGPWDWLANGLLFTLKHIYMRWTYPGIFIGGLCFAFAAGPMRSLPLAMVFHWVGNFLFQIIFLTLAVLGLG